MLLLNSFTVVLPRFCVVISMSDSFVASSALRLYPLIAVVRISTALAPDVNPPFANFMASVVNSTALV